MAQVPGTLEGWYVLHDFRTMLQPRWKGLAPQVRVQAIEELQKAIREAESVAPDGGASAAYWVLGHKADLLFIHLRPTLAELAAIEHAFDGTAFADCTSRAYSYLSVTELSLYEAGARAGTEDASQLQQTPFVRKRLYPQIPPARHVCFYPMNKRRGEAVNWYTADLEERRRMMREHGATGRKYHGRVIQMISGSMGLDDWEWGVTLWAEDPLDIKKLVYEMRFDEVSAKYAEFGPFFVGLRMGPEEVASTLGGNAHG
ncbi:MAG: hydrogen peroxide-dependent heme synthase [Chthonomonadales bacterium]